MVMRHLNMGRAEEAESVVDRIREARHAADIRALANAFGTDHHPIELSFTEQTVQLEELAWWLDEPVADLGALGFLALSQLAAQHVTVALSGQGADELLAGYSRYTRAAAVGQARRLPGAIRHAGEAVLRRGPDKYVRFAAALAAPDPATRQLALRGQWVPAELYGRLARGGLATAGGDTMPAPVV